MKQVSSPRHKAERDRRTTIVLPPSLYKRIATLAKAQAQPI
jgi:hypothetical protein